MANITTYCANCGKMNAATVSVRVLKENNDIIYDDFKFTCWQCKYINTVRLESPTTKPAQPTKEII